MPPPKAIPLTAAITGPARSIDWNAWSAIDLAAVVLHALQGVEVDVTARGERPPLPRQHDGAVAVLVLADRLHRRVSSANHCWSIAFSFSGRDIVTSSTPECSDSRPKRS